MVSHLGPGILQCEVKCPLESITINKASRGDGTPAALLKTLSDNAVQVLHSVCQRVWETQQWPQNWKRPVFISMPKKGSAKESSDCCTTALVSHASKVMLKILQVRRQQCMNQELPDIQAGFRKGRGARDQTANVRRLISESKGIPEKCLQFH